MKNKILPIILSVSMALSVCACGNEANRKGTSESQSVTTSTNEATSEKTTESEVYVPTYPIVDEPMTLTWFHTLMNSNVISSMDEQYCWQEVQKVTGIDIEWVHPAVGTEKENINIAIASRDLPDIITWTWNSQTGGAAKMIEDEVIIPLNEYEEYMPNYMAWLEENELANKSSRLDDGTLYGFSHIIADESVTVTGGFMLRKDWLEKLDLEVPNTIDEWYTVLKAFKEKDPNGNGIQDEIPFVCNKGAHFVHMATAFGVRSGFYVDKQGEVHYGPIEEGYREFLETMAKWYAEGLIDPEYVTNDTKNVNAKVLSDQAGSLYGSISSQLASYIKQKEGTGFDLVAVKAPADESGVSHSSLDARKQGVNGQTIAISSNCKNPIQAVQLIDYLFGEEGRMLTNWGKEGESYEIVNGKPQFTEFILNNPDGLSALDAIAKYAFPIYGYAGPFYMDSYAAINLQLPQQQQAVEEWSEESTELILPTLYPTDEETEIYTDVMTEVSTYRSEMFTKFIIGKEPLDKFDEYVETIKKYGIDDVIAVKQAQYDRYIAK